MSNQTCVMLPIENQNLRLWYDLESVMNILVKIHRFPINSVEQLRCQVLLRRVRSPLASEEATELQSFLPNTSFTKVDVAALLSGPIFVCKCSRLPCRHGRGRKHQSLSLFTSSRQGVILNKVDSIVWTSEAEASLLSPQQHKVAFRDVVAEKTIRFSYQ